MYTRTWARSASVAPSPDMPCRAKLPAEINASMLSSVCRVCASTSPWWRLVASGVLAGPATKVGAGAPAAGAVRGDVADGARRDVVVAEADVAVEIGSRAIEFLVALGRAFRPD